MRLRRRPRRSTAAAEPPPPFDAWTTVGNLDSHARVEVDPAGRVHVYGRGWVLDWWIGAEDRWHRPSQEAAVRQQLVGASPVVETRVRIPSGDAVSRAYAARGQRGEDLLVFEVENDSKVPVALALVAEAHAGGEAHEIELAGLEVRVDGERICLPRSPGRFALSMAADERSAGEVVLEGDAATARAASVSCPDGGAQGVLLFPLAHTATLRIVVPLDRSDRAIDVATLPSARQVASGWGSHSASGARLEVPDRRLREAIAASTRFLLLEPEGELSLATIAARWSMRGERPAMGPLELAGLVEAWTRTSSPGERSLGHLALPAIADLLDAMQEPRAAQDVRSLHASSGPAGDLADPHALLQTASSTFTWRTERSGHDLASNAALLLAVRNLLVDERADELALSPVVPDAWLGLGWEVHDVPTRFGRLSFAVRWHGERPALLWELEPPPGRGPVRLTTPALDARWSTTDAHGDALLEPVPVPERPSGRKGITIPVTIEPMRRRS